MSKLKSAELNASPFPYHAKPGDLTPRIPVDRRHRATRKRIRIAARSLENASNYACHRYSSPHPPIRPDKFACLVCQKQPNTLPGLDNL